jgi:dihydroxy-acid dehydratase
MSGTAYGTIVLHVTPEAASGGPLALARTGDRIRISVRERTLELLVDAAEFERRRSAPTHSEEESPPRGYARLYREQVLQADEGCDFAFLAAREGAASMRSGNSAAKRSPIP